MNTALGDERHVYNVISLATEAIEDAPDLQEWLDDGLISIELITQLAAIHISLESGRHLDACRQVGEAAAKLMTDLHP